MKKLKKQRFERVFDQFDQMEDVWYVKWRALTVAKNRTKKFELEKKVINKKRFLISCSKPTFMIEDQHYTFTAFFAEKWRDAENEK